MKLHKLRITHRDLKPANLFLDEKDEVKIGDFGVSIQSTIAQTPIGTPGYFAPEVLKSQGYTKSADLWSLGCIILDLLTLTTAEDVNGMEIKKRMEMIPKSYNVEWKNLLKVMLIDDPKKRISVSDVKSFLLKFPTPWESTACRSWEQKGNPMGILSFQQHVFICNWFPSNFLIYNVNDEKKFTENLSFKDPYGIDIDEKNNILYISDENNVTLVNLKLEIISSWKLPKKNNGYRWIKN